MFKFRRQEPESEVRNDRKSRERRAREGKNGDSQPRPLTPSRLTPYGSSSMRVLNFLIAMIFILTLGIFSCQQVQKPELKGEGPLAITVDRGASVPEFHAPLERWRTLHVEALNRGDFSQRECVLCHNPKTGCNQCHRYVGAKEISVAEASLYWSDAIREKK